MLDHTVAWSSTIYSCTVYSVPRSYSSTVLRVGIYSHFWLLLHEYTLLYSTMYTYMYIDIQRIQYTDSMAPSFVKFCQVYHAFARAHTNVYFGQILLLHEYTLHSYTTKYTLHYVYSHTVSAPGAELMHCTVSHSSDLNVSRLFQPGLKGPKTARLTLLVQKLARSAWIEKEWI